jgi:hypothetical protein
MKTATTKPHFGDVIGFNCDESADKWGGQHMKGEAVFSMVLFTSACASGPPAGEQTDDWQYRRDTAQIEVREEFEELKETCSRSRGAVLVRREFSRRIKSAEPEMRLATCEPGAAGALF